MYVYIYSLIDNVQNIAKVMTYFFRIFLDFFPIFPLIYNNFLNFRKTGRFFAETARFLDKTARFSLYRKPMKPSGFRMKPLD